MIASLLLLAQSPAQSWPRPEFTRESSSFGSVVSAAGDQDGDGTPDFLVGEPVDYRLRRFSNEDELDCWLLSGKDGSTIRRLRARRTTRIECGEEVEYESADCLVLSAPAQGSECCGLAYVARSTGREAWHTPLYRGSYGRLRAHLVPVSIAGSRQSPSLELAVLCLYSCIPGALPLEWTNPEPNLTVELGWFVIEDQTTGLRREFRVLLDPGKPMLDTLPRGIRFRNERDQLARAPEEWGGGAGSVALLGDLDGDGFGEVSEGFMDRVYIDSGRTEERLFVLGSPERTDYVLGFGAAVAGLGDVNDDGIEDFIVSETETPVSGSVRAYSGAERGIVWVACPPHAKGVDGFGLELALTGDVDCDGTTDLIVGSWEGSTGEPGYAALLSGRTGVPLLEFRRGDSGVVALKPDLRRSWLPLK